MADPVRAIVRDMEVVDLVGLVDFLEAIEVLEGCAFLQHDKESKRKENIGFFVASTPRIFVLVFLDKHARSRGCVACEIRCVAYDETSQTHTKGVENRSADERLQAGAHMAGARAVAHQGGAPMAEGPPPAPLALRMVSHQGGVFRRMAGWCSLLLQRNARCV
jgi:hypothetical protein